MKSPEFSAMGQTQLLSSFIGLNSYYGLIFGPILGILFYLIVFQFSMSFYIIYFAIFGGAVGILLGGINGLICGIVTLAIRVKYQDNRAGARRNRFTLLISSVITTFVSGYIIFNSVFSLYSATQNPDSTVVLLATLMATGASGYASQVMFARYLNQALLSSKDG